jgi:NitT/TauT family transport system substrate-binding protein
MASEIRGHAQNLPSGEVDIALTFIPTDILQIDAGAPIVVLAGSHAGCVELVAHTRIRSTLELKGKIIGISTDEKNFISMFAAYVGLDPQRDINWAVHPIPDIVPLFLAGKIDAFMTGPPESLELRAKKIGHVLVNTTTDKPWAQYFCCLIATRKDFVRNYPVATKRALRAILKGADLCASEPERVARFITDKGLASYDNALQMLRELPYRSWRETDLEDSLRFFALRMRDVGLIKASPQSIIANGTDLRFLKELKRELKA